MPEPLKGKRKFDIADIISRDAWLILEGKDAKGCFLFVDIKSAVEWLLNEIEKEKKNIEGIFVDGDDFLEGELEGLKVVEEKIKQAFPDVFENDDKELQKNFIKEVQEAEKRVKEGKAKKYTVDEFKKKFMDEEVDAK